MTTKSLEAIVKNRINPDGEAIYHRKEYSQSMFRVTLIVETFSVTDKGATSYEVEIFGKVQTASGGDHARNRGNFIWREGGTFSYSTIDEIPAEIRKYLAGRDELARVVLI